jgi:hypothetical protein
VSENLTLHSLKRFSWKTDLHAVSFPSYPVKNSKS